MSGTPEKLRVAVISNDLMVGGVQRNIVAWLRHFNRERFDLHMICACAGGELVDEVKALGIPVLTVKGVWKPKALPFLKSPSLTAIRQIAEYLTEHQIQIVQTRLFLGNWIGRVAAAKAGVPVVVAAEHSTYHDKNFLHILIDKRLAANTDAIVAVSKAVKEFTVKQEKIPASKFHVIHNGIDTVKFQYSEAGRARVRREFKIAEAAPVIGSAARLIEEKNFKQMFHIFNNLLFDFPELKFLLAGDGEERAALELAVQELGIGHSVIFTGRRNDVADLMSAMDIVVLPSRREGLPTVVLEAMACARPVVGNDIPQIRELIDDGVDGYVAPIADEAAFRARIAALLDDPARRAAMGAAGAHKARERFTIQQMVGNYEKLYSDLWRKYNEQSEAANNSRRRAAAKTGKSAKP